MSNELTLKGKYNTLKSLYNRYSNNVDFIVNLTDDQFKKRSKMGLDFKNWFCKNIKILATFKPENLEKFLKRNEQAINDLYESYEKYKNAIVRSFSQFNTTRERESKPREYKPRETNTQQDWEYEYVEYEYEVPEPEVHRNKPIRKAPKENTTIPFNSHLILRQDEEGQLINPSNVISLDDELLNKYERVPSINRSNQEYIFRKLIETSEHPLYTDYYKPKSKNNLFKKDEANKFCGPRHSWMFDIMYFSNSDGITVNYLVGIEINTRFAIGLRIKDKSTESLIRAFDQIRQNETIKYIRFDGEAGINSNDFEKYCRKNNISLLISKPKIHTQTALVDRLCRTLRRYFIKWYMFNHPEYQRILTTKPLVPKYMSDMSKHVLQVRKYFAKEGESKNMISPIPRLYIIRRNGNKEYVNDDTHRYVHDEFLDVIEYYNNKLHKRLTRILEEAVQHFNVLSIQIPWKNITPSFVHENIEIESIIANYCKEYNLKNPNIYVQGDEVNIYQFGDGSLQPKELLPDLDNPYVIKEILGNVFRVGKENSNNKDKWISKYFIQRTNNLFG